MPTRPTDKHRPLSKRARTETHAAPILTPSTEPEIARGLQRLVNAYMMERTGCTVSLTVTVDTFGGGASCLPRAGAADSSPPSQGGSTGDRRNRGVADASSEPEPAAPEEQRHQCLKCPQSFTRSNDLTRHDLFHTGEKPHQCLKCVKAFSLPHHLKQHERTSHKKVRTRLRK
ncbi:hypothetical protein T484DRAFT_3627541 [Baffinella frigidus]|nr:hypothetical protein T484DRAFT_3627541 [Cryptophyta sp. CCMP2293]